ncbi:MAG TPA: hypothetical protein VKU41_00280 [Polyangiaceae bacterium]|nr:hypothetical protein [Polyangiaceae bacterium]
MGRDILGRWSAAVAVAFSALVAASCGSSQSTFEGGKGHLDASVPRDGAALNDGGFGAFGGLRGCNPGTCASLGYTCGMNSDGCGGVLSCGDCTSPEFCGGGGFSKCGVNSTSGSDAASSCVPKTCQDLGFTCGPASDGCGGLLQCGACRSPAYCGGGGYNVCGLGDGGACTPATCTSLGYACGPAGDGCGGTLDCGVCASPSFCGGAGFAQCGTGGDGGVGSSCVPETCQELGYTCGAAGDGCGGLIQCGTCSAPGYCGGGGFDKCGGIVGLGPDGGPLVACTPATCQSLGYQCGPAADGCGGLLDCGTCPGGQTCGGGGAFKCGSSEGGTTTTCVPKTCQSLGFNCGVAGDGCGGLLTCGSCSSPQFCGGGGFNVCGSNNGLGPDGGAICTPRTCQDLGFNCGPAGDGCGGLLDCGSCTSPQFCGGGGFNKCGSGGTDGGPPASCLNVGSACSFAGQCCTGQCAGGVCAFPTCVSDGGSCTGNTQCCSGSCSSGTCASLNNTCRTLGNTCTQDTQCCSQHCNGGLCAASSYCRQNGDVCSASSDCCGGVCTLAGGATYGTCGQPAAGGANCSMVDGAVCGAPGSTPPSCGGPCCSRRCAPYGPTGVLVCQTASGCHPVGDICTTDADCCGSAGLPGGSGKPVSCSIAPGSTVGVCVNPHGCKPNGDVCKLSTMSCNSSCDCCAGNCETQDTCKEDNVGVPRCTAAACLGAGQACASSADCCNGLPCVPNTGTGPVYVCGSTSCVASCGACTDSADCCGGQCNAVLGSAKGVCGPCGTPTCTPKTCQQQNITCGPTGDGCGNPLDCGSCTAPQTCGGGGVPGQCGAPDAGACTPKTCVQQNIACGPAGDGCGNQLNCGTCVAPQTCGGGGVAYQCGGPPPAGGCTPTTCAQQNLSCGPAGNGCGGTLDCGTCLEGQSCGGGGVRGQCGAPPPGVCAPVTCQRQNITCGPAGDGCGGILDCGMCPTGQSCGGGGVPGQCGAPDGGSVTCTPRTCQQQGIGCGPAGDGCGGSIDCGACILPQTCGGGGVPGQCGGSSGCQPLTCAQLNLACGPAGDGCGGLLQCGTCPPPQTCGGGGVPGQCGGTGTCVPSTCQSQNIACGPAGDGCGGLLQCGTCNSPQTCGGGGVSGQCGGGTM